MAVFLRVLRGRVKVAVHFEDDLGIFFSLLVHVVGLKVVDDAHVIKDSFIDDAGIAVL